MSRETLDDDRSTPRDDLWTPREDPDLRPLPTQEIHVGASPSGEADEPAISPGAGRTRRQLVQACAATALVVAVVAGVATTAIGRDGTAADRTALPRLLGSYVDTDFSMTVRGGIVPFQGRVQVVNAGPLPVEVLRADPWGTTGPDLVRPVLVAPGAAELVGIEVDLPCGTPVDDVISLRVVVVDADGIRGDPVDTELERIDVNPYGGVQDFLLGACASTSDPQAEATGMTLAGDGAVELDVTPLGDGRREVRMTLQPRAGLEFSSDSVTLLDLAEGQQGHLRAALVVTDCAWAREALVEGYDLVALETSEPSAGLVTSYSWVEGWSPTVTTAAIGFAVARQCG